MYDMEQQTLPIPNPGDWMTRQAAAHVLGVDPRTVDRMVENRRLTDHRPIGAPQERPPLLLWREEVRELVRARARAGLSVGAL